MQERERIVSKKPRAKFTLDHLQHPVVGLEEVYENFQRYFASQYKGEGYEGQDLSQLLSLYKRWHQNLFPFSNFDTFIRKLERIGHTKECQNLVKEYRQRTIDAMREIPSSKTADDDCVVDGVTSVVVDEIPSHEQCVDAEIDDLMDSLGM